jgi:hypothetical protein
MGCEHIFDIATMSFHDSLIAKFDIYKNIVMLCIESTLARERYGTFGLCKFLMFSSFVPNLTLDYQKDTTSSSCADDEFILSI